MPWRVPGIENRLAGAAPPGPQCAGIALSRPGVLERGRASTSRVTWARTGEPGRASLSLAGEV